MNLTALANCVQDWLKKEDVVVNHGLMREGFLAVPIVNHFLSDGRLGRIELERLYPEVLQKSKDRRNWIAMDMAVFEKQSQKLSFAIEAKWANQNRCFKDEFYAEAFRLAALHRCGTRTCCLLVAGEMAHIVGVFDTTVRSRLVRGWKSPAFTSFPYKVEHKKGIVKVGDIIGFGFASRALERSGLGTYVDLIHLRVEVRESWCVGNGPEMGLIIWKVWTPKSTPWIKRQEVTNG